VMSSLLPGLAKSSRDGRPVDDDTESPRRRYDSEVKKSDEDELLLECDLLVGVAGGVKAPLSCIFAELCAPGFEELMRVGESGGVEAALEFAGFEFLRPGTASL
jgi:hypothetical protein